MLVMDATWSLLALALKIMGIDMAAVEEMERATVVSGEALNLLDCFECGFSEVVYQLAAEYAQRRTHDCNPEITVDDVRQAGETVINGLQEMIKLQQLPADFSPRVEQMRECFRLNNEC